MTIRSMKKCAQQKPIFIDMERQIRETEQEMKQY